MVERKADMDSIIEVSAHLLWKKYSFVAAEQSVQFLWCAYATTWLFYMESMVFCRRSADDSCFSFRIRGCKDIEEVKKKLAGDMFILYLKELCLFYGRRFCYVETSLHDNRIQLCCMDQLCTICSHWHLGYIILCSAEDEIERVEMDFLSNFRSSQRWQAGKQERFFVWYRSYSRGFLLYRCTTLLDNLGLQKVQSNGLEHTWKGKWKANKDRRLSISRIPYFLP